MEVSNNNMGDFLGSTKAMFVNAFWGDLEDTYHIVRSIGSGAYGNILLAKHRATQVLRAVKRLHKGNGANTQALLNEVSTLKQCDHPNIVKLFEVFENETHVFLINEYCEGGDLLDHVRKTSIVEESQIAEVMGQVLAGLNYLHMQKIFHRDIKPENLMVTHGTIKLIDFGLAQSFDQQSCNTRAVGTSYYMSPEARAGNYSPACDVWSLGVVLSLMLLKRSPFMCKTNTSAIVKAREGILDFDRPEWIHVSSACKDLLGQMLDRDPKTRITAQSALLHPWLNKPAPVSLKLDCKAYTLFFSGCRLRKLLQVYLAYTCDESYLSHFRPIFTALDTEVVGIVSSKEITQRMSCNGFCTDTTHAGVIGGVHEGSILQLQFSEFIALCSEGAFLASQDRIRDAFNLFDFDGTKSITAEKVRTVLWDFFQDKEECFWEELFADADVSGDGVVNAKQINFEAFVALVST